MGGKKSSPAPEPPKPDPMIPLIAQMQTQQREQASAAAEAQRQALLQQQSIAGQQSEQIGEASAKQQLAQMGSMQAIRDANALAAMQQAQSTAGQQATGGGFDLGRSREESLTNMGALGTAIPPTPVNLAANPALGAMANQRAYGTPKPLNVFSLPTSSDLRFGGS